MANWCEWIANILVGFGALINPQADKNVGAPKKVRCIAWLAMLTILTHPRVFSAEPAPPDFAGPIVTPKLRPMTGERALLVILWDPREPAHPAPPKDTIEKMLFGPGPSVSGWYQENSGGRFRLKKAGVLGWYHPDHPASEDVAAKPESTGPHPEGSLAEQRQRWAEAIGMAGQEFNFAAYDRNHDGRLTADELGILVVIPQKYPKGDTQALFGSANSARGPIVVSGLRIFTVAEWHTGRPPNFGSATHELAHLFLGLPDLYNAPQWPYAPGAYCLMDACFTTSHLNPFFKLKLGWLKYTLVTQSGEYALKDVATNNKGLILYDPTHGAEEYFILENRWRGKSFDAGLEWAGQGIPASGLAVWRILEAPNLYNRMNPPLGGRGEWGRRGIQLLRADGGLARSDASALFDKPTMKISPQTKPARLCWSDNSPAPFAVELRTMPGQTIRLKIDLLK